MVAVEDLDAIAWQQRRGAAFMVVMTGDGRSAVRRSSAASTAGSMRLDLSVKRWEETLMGTAFFW